MKKLLLTLAAMACVFSASAAKQKKALVVIVDGVCTDVVERLRVPVLYDIAYKGFIGESYVGGERGAYSQTPTISAVGYNTMLTGTWVNKHNVWGNSDMHPNYNYWTIFRIAKAQQRPVSTAIFSSWTDNRTVLLGEGLESNDNLKIDYVYDGYDLDKEHYPHKEKDLHVFDYDEAVSANAAECIRRDAPDLSWVYLWYPDDAAHRYGDGAYQDEYVLKAGEQIARVWEAVKYREQNFDEEWMVVVTTDHGRKFLGHKHGGQSDRERRTWIATNVKPNKHFREGRAAMVDINPSICRFMGFEIPFEVMAELDGVPFIGKLDVVDMTLARYDDTVTISWKALDRKAGVDIYVAVGNGYKETGSEHWDKIATVKAGEEKYVYNMPDQRFRKFLLVAPDNTQNRWYCE